MTAQAASALASSGHTHVDLELAEGRADVDAGAAGPEADIGRDAAVVVGQRLDAGDLPGGLQDGAVAVLMSKAGMARLAVDLDDIARAALARRHALVAVAAGLQHQHVFVGEAKLLDQVAAGRAADLLVRREQKGDRQRRLQARPHELPERGDAEAGAAFHVVDAGPVEIAVLLLQLQRALDRAVRVDRVQVGHDQDARPVAAPGRARDDAVAIAVAARPAADRHAERAHRRLGDVDDLVDRDAVLRRRLDPGPLLDVAQDFGRVDLRQVAGVAHWNISGATVS